MPLFTRADISFLEAAFENHGASMKELSESTGFSYTKIREAQSRVKSSGMLQIGAMLNARALGMERYLILLENPSLVLSTSYRTPEQHLFVDGQPRLVFSTIMAPIKIKNDLVDMIEKSRSHFIATAYTISPVQASFSGMYYGIGGDWLLDLLHLSMCFDKFVNSASPIVTKNSTLPRMNKQITYEDAIIMDALLNHIDASSATYFPNLPKTRIIRKKNEWLRNHIIVPRGRVSIPQLSERIVVLCNRDANDCIWQNLPLTYTYSLQNVADKSDKKMLLLSALPTGTSRGLLDIIGTETSKALEISAWKIAAGRQRRSISLSRLFDWGKKTLLPFEFSQHVDAWTYSVMRHEASIDNIPFDLAEI